MIWARLDDDDRVELQAVRPFGAQDDQIGAETLGVVVARVDRFDAIRIQDFQYLRDAPRGDDHGDAAGRDGIDLASYRAHEGRRELDRGLRSRRSG